MATSEPAPSPSACGSYPNVYAGTLSGPGARAYHPPGSSYTNTVAGVHRGCLDGPEGADFDLYLERRSLWGGWSAVTSATSPGFSPRAASSSFVVIAETPRHSARSHMYRAPSSTRSVTLTPAQASGAVPTVAIGSRNSARH